MLLLKHAYCKQKCRNLHIGQLIFAPFKRIQQQQQQQQKASEFSSRLELWWLGQSSTGMTVSGSHFMKPTFKNGCQKKT